MLALCCSGYVLELVALSPMDFRDARMLTMVSVTLRAAMLQGPLLINTDQSRPISHGDLATLLFWLQWCGCALRSLRLDQQPKSLWMLPGLPGDGSEERQQAAMQIMAEMPPPLSSTLSAIVECCPNLEELALHDWHGYCDYCPSWLQTVAEQLCFLPRLKRAHLPSAGNSDDVNSNPITFNAAFDACPELTQLSLKLRRHSAEALLSTPHAARLMQLSLHSPNCSVLTLLPNCTNLVRLHLQEVIFDHFELFHYLPATTRVLTLAACSGLVKHCANSTPAALPLLSVTFGGNACSSSPCRFSSKLILDLCHIRTLRVLQVPGTEFDDCALDALASSCSRLHTLDIANTSVSVAGFDMLSGGTLLPQLRVASYTNSCYEAVLDEFFSKNLSNLIRCEAEDLDEMNEMTHGSDVEHARCVGMVRVFGFCKLVLARNLVVPLDTTHGEVLPTNLHTLCSNYFALE